LRNNSSYTIIIEISLGSDASKGENLVTKRKPIDDSEIQPLASEIREQAKDLKGEIFLSFSYTADVFNRYLDIQLAKRNSSRTRFGILHNLITHGGSMTPTEIAKRVFRSKHAVTRAIDVLEKDGLVRRGTVRGDRRLRKVSITREGLRIVAANMDDRRDISQRAMSGLNQRQSEGLKVILKRLRKHLLNLIESD
jgi:DNA-binding MarR family transcriptional regulator